MKIRLVFDDWRDRSGGSIYATPMGVELASGQLHSGSIFEATIDVAADEESDLRVALQAGYVPVFYVIKPKKEEER